MGYVELTCNGPEDCPGQLCCAAFQVQGQQAFYNGISCAPTCDQQNQLVVCSDANPTCPPGAQCQDSQLLGDGYKICRN
jgi:hypothetical protein